MANGNFNRNSPEYKMFALLVEEHENLEHRLDVHIQQEKTIRANLADVLRNMRHKKFAVYYAVWLTNRKEQAA